MERYRQKETLSDYGKIPTERDTLRLWTDTDRKRHSQNGQIPTERDTLRLWTDTDRKRHSQTMDRY
jgi:hypothetical protein